MVQVCLKPNQGIAHIAHGLLVLSKQVQRISQSRPLANPWKGGKLVDGILQYV